MPTCLRAALFVILILAGGCQTATPVLQDEYRLAETVEVRRLTGDVWLHTSVHEVDGQPVVSNGLVVASPDGALLVNVGWNDAQARVLMEWAEETLRRPVRAGVGTHAHADGMGGIGALRAAGIPVYAQTQSAELAPAQGWPAPDRLVDEAETVRLGGRVVEVYYPGPGHAPDNVVVWVAEERVLFGGCFVKSADAPNLGYTGDADIAAWPGAVTRVAERYPEAALVVPGHGAVGDRSLLDHTIHLARQAGAR